MYPPPPPKKNPLHITPKNQWTTCQTKQLEQLQGTTDPQLTSDSRNNTIDLCPSPGSNQILQTRLCNLQSFQDNHLGRKLNWLIGAIIFIFNFLAMLSHRMLESMLFYRSITHQFLSMSNLQSHAGTSPQRYQNVIKTNLS